MVKTSSIIHVLTAFLLGICVYVLASKSCQEFYEDIDNIPNPLDPSPSTPPTSSTTTTTTAATKDAPPKQSAEEVCQLLVADKCKDLRETWEKAKPSAAPNAFHVWKLCAKTTYNECACKSQKEILQGCYDSLKNQEPGKAEGDRVTGCYAPDLNKDQQKACLEDPVKFLCVNPESQMCLDVKAQCSDPCAKEEDIFAPVPDIA